MGGLIGHAAEVAATAPKLETELRKCEAMGREPEIILEGTS